MRFVFWILLFTSDVMLRFFKSIRLYIEIYVHIIFANIFLISLLLTVSFIDIYSSETQSNQ